MQLKKDPKSLPIPKLPPTKLVDIGEDKLSYIPTIKKKKEYEKWTDKDVRILIKLKERGLRNVDISKKMGRSYEAIKTKLKLLKRQGRI